MEVELNEGFKKGDSSNIPAMTNEMVFDYITRLGNTGREVDPMKASPPKPYKIDFVQVKNTKPVEVRAIAFTGKEAANNGERFNIYMKINETQGVVNEEGCERCMDSKKADLCEHVVAFLFWLNKQTVKADSLPFRTFWGSEYEAVPKNNIDEIVQRLLGRGKPDVEAIEVPEDDGEESDSD